MPPKTGKRLRKPDLSPRVSSEPSAAPDNVSTAATESDISSAVQEWPQTSPDKTLNTGLKDTEMTDACSTFDENQLITSRSSQLDISDGFDIVSKLRSLLDEIVSIRKGKTELTDDEKSKLAQLRCDSSIMLMLMRRLNRYGQLRCKSLREQSVEKKDLVDEKHIKLLGVQYEVSHLKKQIQNCFHFKSDDEDIEFVNFEYFSEKASSDIYDKEKIGDDPYLLRLAQLQFELAERKKLAAEFKDAVRERAKLKTSIEQKKRKLTTLLPNVDEVIKATKPLEQSLGVESFFSETRQRLKYLPAPLFVLYCQAMAYAEAFGNESMVHVKILGEVPENESSVDPMVILAEDDERESNGNRTDPNDQGPNPDWKPRETSCRAGSERVSSTVTAEDTSSDFEGK